MLDDTHRWPFSATGGTLSRCAAHAAPAALARDSMPPDVNDGEREAFPIVHECLGRGLRSRYGVSTISVALFRAFRAWGPVVESVAMRGRGEIA